jgi:hypothetical protein
MSDKADLSDFPEHLERWDENLAQHVEGFSPLPAPGQPTFDTLENILKTAAQWYVRKDGKYYDVEEPGPVFSRNDIERVIIQRLKEEFPSATLSEDDVRQMLQVLIKDVFVDPRRSIPIWSGLRQSLPGNPNRLSFKRMAATINTWREPTYRYINNTKADMALFDDFMRTTFTRDEERKMLTDWLVWCLKNENDKPGWAPFLFSAEKGSGKSTFAKVAGLLFGGQNTATENNINKLVSRFNAPILEKKLVICEELYLPPGSDKANAIKTFITEKGVVVEHKYQSVQQVEQFCCFIFITNHKPVWLEEGDRRFYVVHVDHDGFRFGPKGTPYAAMVGRLIDHLAEPKNVSALYKALMQHEISEDFDPYSLQVVEKSTAVMQEIQGSSFDINRKAVEEHLQAMNAVAVTMDGLKDMVENRLSAKIAALKHVMADLGWVSQDVKWGGADYRRVIWLSPGCTISGGKISHPDGWKLDTTPKPAIGSFLSNEEQNYFSRQCTAQHPTEPTIKDDEPIDF